ncbi:unnamed protein product [Onchocerca ochengi]|uniref:SufE domain-containing protein n=1 Tax=Onchocerca ochengi TaxID=42157 RepID=A0A182EXR6_ONCOC|nr:unnamed protein product [Onchocerca ochengi]
MDLEKDVDCRFDYVVISSDVDVRQSFDYIPALLGVFNRIIQNPDYPNEYNNSLSCSSSVMLESSRPILAKFLIMDIEESAL